MPFFSVVEYNSKGHKTRATDPVGRETIFEYAANGIDLLTVKQKRGASYDVLQTTTYNSQHEPLTMTDAAGQVTLARTMRTERSLRQSLQRAVV